MNHDTWGRGGGGSVCSNNPDHKVGMLAQRILKMPSSISLGVLELQSPNILTYLMNVSCMDDIKKGVLSFVSGGKLCPHPLPLCTERHPMCRLKIPSVV